MQFRKIAGCLGFSLLLGIGPSFTGLDTSLAQQIQANPDAAATIPYKQEQRSFAEQSVFTTLVTLALLGATVAGLYYFRNHLQKKTGGIFIRPPGLQIKERVRVNTKLTMYVVSYREKEILLAHSGDVVTVVSELSADPNSNEPPNVSTTI